MENSETQKYANSVSEQGRLDPQERLRRLREIQLPEERKIFKHPDWEIAWPEKVSSIGFVVITLICAAILFGTWLIGKLLAGL
jgi:hypothetical protein